MANTPDNTERNSLPPHGYKRETDTLNIRLSSARPGFGPPYPLAPNLWVHSTFNGNTGRIEIENAKKTMKGIVDFDKQQVDAAQLKSQTEEIDALQAKLELVEHFHPGIVNTLSELVDRQAEVTFTSFPNSNTEWRKGFPGAPRQVFKNPVFNRWVKKIGTKERVKVTTALLEEHVDLTEMNNFDNSVSNRERLTYLTHHGWD